MIVHDYDRVCMWVDPYAYFLQRIHVTNVKDLIVELNECTVTGRIQRFVKNLQKVVRIYFKLRVVDDDACRDFIIGIHSEPFVNANHINCQHIVDDFNRRARRVINSEVFPFGAASKCV